MNHSKPETEVAEEELLASAPRDAERLLEVAPKVFDLARNASGIAAALFEHIRRHEMFRAAGVASMQEYATARLGIHSEADYKKTCRAGCAAWDLYPDACAKAIASLLGGGYPGNPSLPALPNKSLLEGLPRFLRRLPVDQHAHLLERAAAGQVRRDEIAPTKAAGRGGEGALVPGGATPRDRDVHLDDREATSKVVVTDQGASDGAHAVIEDPNGARVSAGWDDCKRAFLETVLEQGDAGAQGEAQPSEEQVVAAYLGLVGAAGPSILQICDALEIEAPQPGRAVAVGVEGLVDSVRQRVDPALDAAAAEVERAKAALEVAQAEYTRLKEAEVGARARDLQVIERAAAAIARYNDFVRSEAFQARVRAGAFTNIDPQWLAVRNALVRIAASRRALPPVRG